MIRYLLLNCPSVENFNLEYVFLFMQHCPYLIFAGFKFQKKTGPVVSEELDEHGRPYHKIALLCGPPGLGKTTLAHMIARQAGNGIFLILGVT